MERADVVVVENSIQRKIGIELEAAKGEIAAVEREEKEVAP